MKTRTGDKAQTTVIAGSLVNDQASLIITATKRSIPYVLTHRLKDCHGAGSIFLHFEIDDAPRKDVNRGIVVLLK